MLCALSSAPAPPHPAPLAYPPGSLHHRGDTITDFLTDGSLAALCLAFSRLTGADVRLVDNHGRTITVGDHEQPWGLMDADPRSDSIRAALSDRTTAGSILVEPIIIAGKPVGGLTAQLAGNDSASDTARREMLAFALEMLASTVSEFCENELEMERRHAELRVLYRLSSLLVAARDVTTVLGVALRSAVESLGMNAGVVHLLSDDETTLELRAHAGLSPDTVASLSRLTGPASGGAESALADWSVGAIESAATSAGVPNVVSVALMFSQRPIGVLRLFSHETRLLDPGQTALLQTIAEQAAAAVASARHAESERANLRIRRQLELAADVQRRMLPEKPPELPRLDVAARYEPSLELSGDFYDLLNLNGHLGVALGDVSGKGLPAALLMAGVRASLRAHALDLYHINDIVARVNRAMVRDTLRNEFATIFYGVIDPKTLRLTYCNAGQDPPMVLQLSHLKGKAPGPDAIFELTAGGMLIGVDTAAKYDRGMFDLRAGDVFLAYTDGLVDAMNFENKKFGRPRLKESLLSFVRDHPDASAKTIADHLVWEVRRFTGLREATDDTTLVVIRVKP